MNLSDLGHGGKIVILAIQALGIAALNAATVHFDDADRGPANSFHVGDITTSAASGGFHPGMPATVSGFGLGSAGPVGQPYSFDQQLHYSIGQDSPDTTGIENAITFEIDPAYTFTSITILPYLTVSGSTTPPPCSFTLEYDVTGTTGPWTDQYFSSVNSEDYGQPLTVSLNPQPAMQFYRFDLQIDTGLAGGEAVNFYDYRQAHLGQEQTFQFGFTVQSLDYTAAPEPGAVTLLMLGCGVWMCRRISRKCA